MSGDYIVLPRNSDARAAIAAARSGTLRTVSISAMNREIVTTLAVGAPIILFGCGAGDLKHLARHNRCIPFNGGAP
jgi:hypothetical protein